MLLFWCCLIVYVCSLRVESKEDSINEGKIVGGELGVAVDDGVLCWEVGGRRDQDERPERLRGVVSSNSRGYWVFGVDWTRRASETVCVYWNVADGEMWGMILSVTRCRADGSGEWAGANGLLVGRFEPGQTGWAELFWLLHDLWRLLTGSSRCFYVFAHRDDRAVML